MFRSRTPLVEVSKIKNTQTPKANLSTFSFRLGVLVLIASAIWIAVLIFGNFGEARKSLLGLAMLFGVGFGFVISRAQICFTSAFRDLFISGRSVLARAVVIGMMVSSIGVFSYIMLGMAPKIMWAGPNALIGGFLFGLGIVLAGACECGWMYRATEGQVHYLIVGLGNVIGSTLLAATWDYYSGDLATTFPRINLLEKFGNYGGLVFNYACLFLLFLLILYIERLHFFKKVGVSTKTHPIKAQKISATYRLDLKSEPCPYPAIRTLELLPELKSGEILELLSDCPQSINQIPVDVKNYGYKMLKIEQFGATIRYYILKP